MTLEKAKELLDQVYEKAKELAYVRDPLAYALYKVWKIADHEGRIRDERTNSL